MGGGGGGGVDLMTHCTKQAIFLLQQCNEVMCNTIVKMYFNEGIKHVHLITPIITSHEGEN